MSADPLPFPNPPQHHAVGDVAEVLDTLADAIERASLTELRVTGQLVGWRRTRTWGQADLVATDPTTGDITARLPLGLPGRTAAAIEARCHTAGHPLTANPTVTVTGGLDVHPRYGPVRLLARTLRIDHAATQTAHDQRLTAREQLADRGLLDRQADHQLPATITRIGVIVGGGTAAQADFRDRITRGNPAVDLHEVNVPTAGPHATDAIAGAITRLSHRGLECICILRGGGPATDLTVFDHPDVVASIGAAPIPVLTGIGHATNHTLADDAAHRALPTPSAVADHIARHNSATAHARTLHEADTARARHEATTRSLASGQSSRQLAQDRLRAAILVAACLAVALIIAVALLALGR